MNLLKLYLTGLILFFSPLMLHAEEGNPPLKITSDRLISDNKSQLITFIGNVKVVREGLTMTADQIEVLQDKSQNGIDMIIARGNVKINREDKHATGDKAVYYQALQKIILTGNPRSWEGKNEVTGDEMTFFINEDRVVVKQGKKEQVNVIFYPEKKE